MKCPRCYGQVSDEDLRCPNCNFVKPNRPLDKSNAAGIAAAPVARKNTGRLKPRRAKPKKTRPRWVNIVAGITASLLVVGMGWYIYYFFTHQTFDPDPHQVQPALNRLRQAPSTKEGMSVDDYLTAQLEKSRRVGNLLKYQGWTVKAITGSRMKVVFAFTYEEKDNSEQRAEWIADLSNDTFTPQTELAAAVYKH
jgi:hypothetical protein